MARAVRWRFWVESVLSSEAVVLLAVTLTSRDWIEVVFGVDPDGRSRALEWVIVVAVVAVALTAAAAARYEWRRAAVRNVT